MKMNRMQKDNGITTDEAAEKNMIVVRLSADEWMARIMKHDSEYGLALRTYIHAATPEVQEAIMAVAKAGYGYGVEDAMESVTDGLEGIKKSLTAKAIKGIA